MSGFSIQIVVNFDKIPQLLSNLNLKPPEIIEHLGKQTVELAQGFVAVDTGTLHDSIYCVMEAPTTAVIFPNPDALNSDSNRYVGDYMLPQEFGTDKMAAHPFMTPAAEAIAPVCLSPETWMPIVAI